MPSMVVTVWPCASGASTRHAGTRRPLRITEHAPQSPVVQPSFVPVNPTALRSAVSLAPRAAKGELQRQALHHGGEVIRWLQSWLARSAAMAAARRVRTPAMLRRYAVVPRLSLIGRAAAVDASAARSSAT